MITKIIPEKGDVFKLKLDKLYGFAFMNKHGGTDMSNWEHNVKYTGKEAIVKITKVWYDYEVGYRCWAEAVNQELKDYLNDNAHPKDKRVFVSEHEIEP
jgi:hypothetical protein